jgi:O-antigen/teichoic acid export membrane protein
VSVLSIGTISAQGFTAIGFWLAARHSTPAEFGNVAAVIAIALMLSDLFDVGTNSVLIRDVAAATNRVRQQQLIARLLGLKLIAGVLALIGWSTVNAVLLLTGHGSAAGLALGAFLACSVLTTTIAGALRGLGLLGRCAIVGTVDRAVMAAATAVLIVGADLEAPALVFGLSAGALVATVVGYALLPPDARGIALPTWTASRQLLRDGLPFGTVGLVTNLQRIDISLVRAAAGAPAAGLYAAASRLIQPLTAVITSTYLALFPRLSSLRESGRHGREGWRATRVTVVATIVAVVPIALLAKPLVRLVLGDPYAGSVPALRLLLVAVVLVAVNQPLMALVQAGGRAGAAAVAVFTGTALGLLALFLGAWTHGATGAASGVVVMQVVIAALLVRCALDDRVLAPA